jgi:hypothetical protein
MKTPGDQLDFQLERLLLALSHSGESSVITFAEHCLEFCRDYQMRGDFVSWEAKLGSLHRKVKKKSEYFYIVKSIEQLFAGFSYGAIEIGHVNECTEIFRQLVKLTGDTDPVTKTLFRPVGPEELALVEDSGWTKFPPRLAHQPIFYPVTNREYAIQIAERWNAKDDGVGFVTRFAVEFEYLAKYSIETVGGSIHQEYWIPAEDLTEFNRHIFGKIVVTDSFGEKQ